MHKLAIPAPAPPALGSPAEPAARARACAVCRVYSKLTQEEDGYSKLGVEEEEGFIDNYV